MVEQDATGTEDAVALAVVDRHPVGEQLGHAVRAARIEGGCLVLRDGLDVAEHLGGGGLVEAGLGPQDADCLQQVQRAQAGDVSSGGGLLEGDGHKTLRSKVVDLVRLGAGDEVQRRAGVREVVFDQAQVRVAADAEFIDAPKVDRAGAAVRAVDDVALLKQRLGEIGAVLAGDAGDDAGAPFGHCLT
ncbi:MAG: hypothetical protein H6R36_162 [Chloroflexi bacterium]|nr:hypothetical protein [Chloroflexota bacterium]